MWERKWDKSEEIYSVKDYIGWRMESNHVSMHHGQCIKAAPLKRQFIICGWYKRWKKRKMIVTLIAKSQSISMYTKNNTHLWSEFSSFLLEIAWIYVLCANKMYRTLTRSLSFSNQFCTIESRSEFTWILL